MSDKVKPRISSGLMELLPGDQLQFDRMKKVIAEVYALFGFTPIETTRIELAEVLLAKAGGETEKQIYRIAKSESRPEVLPFDLTVPLARYVAEHEADLVFPFRRQQIDRVYRGERAGKGRFREFYQCDIDVIGSFNPIVDAEIPRVIYEVFTRLNVGGFTIQLNNRKVLNGFYEHLRVGSKAAEVLRAVDKFDKIGRDGVAGELTELGLSADVQDQLFGFIAIDGSVSDILDQLEKLDVSSELYREGVAELRSITDAMLLLGVPAENFRIDLSIARGLDYYTGTVYETVLDDYPEVGSICSGGRYDDLASHYTKTNLPGVGISIGLTRLFYQLKQAGLIPEGPATVTQVLLLPMSQAELPYTLTTADQLRRAGLNTEIYFEDAKLAKQMKYADRLQIPFVMVIGENEFASGQVTLKNMTTGDQQTLALDAAIDQLRA